MSDETKRLDVDAIEVRANAAARGPWRVEEENVDPNDPAWNVVQGDGVAVAAFLVKRDAEFIASTRDDVPDLVAEVRRLRAEMVTARADGAREMRERAADVCDDRMCDRNGDATNAGHRGNVAEDHRQAFAAEELAATRDAIRALPLPEPSALSGSAGSPLRDVADKAAALVLWHDANTPDGHLNDADGHLWTMIDALRAAGYEMPTGTPTGPRREEMSREIDTLRAGLAVARAALRNYVPRCGACRSVPATKETDDGRVWRLRCDACAVGATSTDVDHADAIRAATVTP